MIRSLAISPDGKTLALGSTNVHVIDLVSSALFAKTAPIGGATEIAFLPDGSFLITAGGCGSCVFKLPNKQ
jgi:hypothetical protein